MAKMIMSSYSRACTCLAIAFCTLLVAIAAWIYSSIARDFRVYKDDLIVAIENEDYSRCEQIISLSGPQAEYKHQQRRYTSLHAAVEVCNPKIVSLLLNSGISPSITDSDGRTALSWAASCYNNKNAQEAYKVTSLLVQHGCDPAVVSPVDGDTPVHRAAAWGATPVLEAAFDSGVEVDIRDSYMNTPLITVVKARVSSHGVRRNNASDSILLLLLQRGADPCARAVDGLSAFKLALLANDTFATNAMRLSAIQNGCVSPR